MIATTPQPSVKPSRVDRPAARSAGPPRRKKKTTRAAMNKTGARILGGFIAALLAWTWGGWGEPLTGVPLSGELAASLGGGCIVLVEWLLVKD